MLTNYGKELMGLQPMRPGESVTARFHSLSVLALQGIELDGSAPVSSTTGCIGGHAYAMAVGPTLNGATRQLVGDDYAENESEWERARGCRRPYAVIHIGPTDEHRCDGVYATESDGRVVTYGGFAHLKDDLRARVSVVLPRIKTSLACGLALPQHQVKPKLVDSLLFGRTDDGRSVHDFLVVGSASATVAMMVEANALNDNLGRVTAMATELRDKVARFYSLALAEEDPLKRFLFFFLSIEVETHATARTLDTGSYLEAAIGRDPRAFALAQPVLAQEGPHWRNLGDRLVLCAILKWRDLSEVDVHELRRLKKVRDKIAHGDLVGPSGRDVASVERFATLLLKPR